MEWLYSNKKTQLLIPFLVIGIGQAVHTFPVPSGVNITNSLTEYCLMPALLNLIPFMLLYSIHFLFFDDDQGGLRELSFLTAYFSGVFFLLNLEIGLFFSAGALDLLAATFTPIWTASIIAVMYAVSFLVNLMIIVVLKIAGVVRGGNLNETGKLYITIMAVVLLFIIELSLSTFIIIFDIEPLGFMPLWFSCIMAIAYFTAFTVLFVILKTLRIIRPIGQYDHDTVNVPLKKGWLKRSRAILITIVISSVILAFSYYDFFDNDDIFAAIFTNDMDDVKKFIDKGVDVNLVHEDKGTPLYATSQFGEEEMIKFLISKGAEIDTPNNEGRTPLMGAAYFGRMEIAKLLLEHGADVNLNDKRGKTALSIAREKEFKEIEQLLLERGAKE